MEGTGNSIIEAMNSSRFDEWELIFIDDCSTDNTSNILRKISTGNARIHILHNSRNSGYGASLKRGIANVSFDRVAIADADGTYPLEMIPELAEKLECADMVVGARTADGAQIPWIRKPAKWLLLKYARILSQSDIKDLNSGLRVFWTVWAFEFWNLLPKGFSFTTTITLAMHTNDLIVKYCPIEYYPRTGKSSIRPFRDTIKFFALVLRTVMLFKPLPVFGGIACGLVLLAGIYGTTIKVLTGVLPDVSVISLFSTGIIFFGLGLIGDLINSR